MKFTLVAAAGAAAALAIAQPAQGTIVMTSPVASTKATGGDRIHVVWNDDGKSPKLSSDWGKVDVYLAAGSQYTQFKLQKLADGMSNTITDGYWRIDPSIGPDGSFYFIRMEGTKMDSKGIPPMAFSARFTLNGMKGKFNSTVMAAAQGKEGTAPGASSSSAAAATTPASNSATALNALTTSRSATTAPNASATTTNKPSGAVSARSEGFKGAAILAVGALAAGVAVLF